MIAAHRSAWEHYIFQQSTLNGRVANLKDTEKNLIFDTLAISI